MKRRSRGRSKAVCSLLEASGTSATKGFIARSPGNVPGRFGQMQSQPELLVADQADLNEIAGALYAQMNNELPDVETDLAQINKSIEICPRQYVTMPMAAGDNPRGVSLVGVRLIPRSKEYSYDNEHGVLTTRVGCEAETIPAGAVKVPPAKPPTNNVDPEEWEPGLPDIDPLLPPPSGWWPPVLPPR